MTTSHLNHQKITPEALERALAAVRAALGLDDQAEIPTRTYDALIAGWRELSLEDDDEVPAPTALDTRYADGYAAGVAHRDHEAPAIAGVLTYQDQPGNVEAWRLGEAARHAKPGGDLIDHGLSLLDQLQQRGFGVVRLVRPTAQPQVRSDG